MVEELIAYTLAEHPAPYREHVLLASIFYSLFAAPIAWAGDLMIDYALVSHACYPGDKPLGASTAGFGGAWSFALAIDLVALLLIARRAGGTARLARYRPIAWSSSSPGREGRGPDALYQHLRHGIRVLLFRCHGDHDRGAFLLPALLVMKRGLDLAAIIIAV